MIANPPFASAAFDSSECLAVWRKSDGGPPIFMALVNRFDEFSTDSSCQSPTGSGYVYNPSGDDPNQVHAGFANEATDHGQYLPAEGATRNPCFYSPVATRTPSMARHLTGRALAIKQMRSPASFGRMVHRSQITDQSALRRSRCASARQSRLGAKLAESADFATTFRFARQSGRAVK